MTNIKSQQWTREIVCELIEVWKKHQLLYNASHPQYKNKRARELALGDIRNALGPKFVQLNIYHIKQKLSSLRGQYSTELKKLQLGEKTKDDVMPYWYGQMEFLKPFLRLSSGSQPSTQDEESPYALQKRHISDFVEVSQNHVPFENESCDEYFSDNDEIPPRKVVKKEITPQGSSLSEASYTPSAAAKGGSASSKEIDAFCDLVKAEILAIPDILKQIILRKKLLNLIYEYKTEQY